MKLYFEDKAAGITLYHGNNREVLPSLDLSGVNLCLTDPPYGTGGWRRSSSGVGSNPSGKLVAEAWDDGEVDWLGLLPPALEAVLTFWPAARTWRLLEAAFSVGFNKHRALYMRKLDPKPMVAGRVAWSVEPIWVLSRDGFVLYGGTDVVEASTPRKGRDNDATGHPYQKPLAVVAWLLAKVKHLQMVIDPFAGSGTTLRACKDSCIPCIGIEQEEKWCEVIARRLDQGVFAFEDHP